MIKSDLGCLSKMPGSLGKAFPILFFFLFMLLKPFYFRPSGSIGVADICLMGCFILLLGLKLWKLEQKYQRSSLLTQRILGRECIRTIWTYKDILLYLFLAFVIVINLSYALRVMDYEFIRYSVFWSYNGMAIWIWREMASRYGWPFFRTVNVAAKINIVVQYAVWISGCGRIFHESWGAVRYMGTFNDPNQMAFFLFMMLLLLWMYRCRCGDRSFWIFFVLSLPVLADSKSTGIWLGMIVWAGLGLVYGAYRLWEMGYISERLLAAGGVCLFLVVAMSLYLVWPSAEFDVRTVDYNLINRIREKIWKVSNGGLYSLAVDRGAGRLFWYPQYLLFGAGEGVFSRFADAGPVNELHSTWLSIWFCYGAIPAVLMVLWLRKILRVNTLWMWCAILGLITESLFLINYRQPMFWMILLYADVTAECVPTRLR